MCNVSGFMSVDRASTVSILECGGSRRPDIQVPVLQIPAGEEEGPGGLPNLLKEGEKEEDEEEKKEFDDDRHRFGHFPCLDDDEEEMQKKRRDEEDMQDSLMVEEGMMLKFPLVPLCHVSSSTAARASRFFTPRRS